MTGLLDTCYVTKTRVEFEIAEMTRFITILAVTHLLFKIVINLKILENSQEYICSEVTENLRNYHIYQNEYVRLTVNQKNWSIWNI